MTNHLRMTDGFYEALEKIPAPTYEWYEETIERETAANEARNRVMTEVIDKIGEDTFKASPTDYSDIILGMQLVGSNYPSLINLLGPPARRVAYMKGLRELRRPHRRAWQFLRRKTFPIRHPWEALKQYMLYHYGESY